MPTTKTITLFTFDELQSEQARDRARQWYRDGMESYEYADSVIEDAQQCAEILGIEFETRDYKTVGGQTRTEPCVWWSGFSSQGDGASFDGTYSYKPGAGKAIREHAPQDAILHGIADALQTAQRPHFYKLTAHCKHSGPYLHSGWMSVCTEHPDESRDIGASADAIRDALRKFADWIYSMLQSEFEYRTADEQVDESLQANEYTFTEEGERA
jgi:hypothetical protein